MNIQQHLMTADVNRQNRQIKLTQQANIKDRLAEQAKTQIATRKISWWKRLLMRQEIEDNVSLPQTQPKGV